MNEEIKNIIKKHDDLKQHILNKIDEVRHLVEMEQYDVVRDLAFFSDCGDGWGKYSREDHCINFSTNPNDEEDLIEVLDYLVRYKKQIKELKEGMNA